MASGKKLNVFSSSTNISDMKVLDLLSLSQSLDLLFSHSNFYTIFRVDPREPGWTEMEGQIFVHLFTMNYF